MHKEGQDPAQPRSSGCEENVKKTLQNSEHNLQMEPASIYHSVVQKVL